MNNLVKLVETYNDGVIVTFLFYNTYSKKGFYYEFNSKLSNMSNKWINIFNELNSIGSSTPKGIICLDNTFETEEDVISYFEEFIY